MTRLEQTWATDVLAAFAGSESGGLCPRAGEVDYYRTFQRMQRRSTKIAALGLRAALWLVSLAPLWCLGRLATFSLLSLRERTELLAQLLRHRSFAVRELTMLLKLTAAMALFTSNSLRARSGYDDVQFIAPSETTEPKRPVRLPIVAPTETSPSRPPAPERAAS